MKRAFFVLLACCACLMAQSPGAFTMADIFRVAKQIYLCGQIEGTRKALLSLGRPDKADEARKLGDDAGCLEIRKLINLVNE